MAAISAQALAPHGEGMEATGAGAAASAAAGADVANANGIYSIVWSAWRSVRPQLSYALYRQPPPKAAAHEPLVHGLLIMDSEWGRDAMTAQHTRARLGLAPAGHD
mmetsp:Transcript_139184/g.240570  ORF Transcript_139184/g.240570 Transcript_139184/m.240570 type:complete len:106 (-) Transcript_139184:33-350(-)